MLTKEKIMRSASACSVLIKELVVKNKKSLILYVAIAVFLALGILLVTYNYKWYDTTIAKIDQTENSPAGELDESSEFTANSTGEKHYNQTLLGTVMNGEFQGHQVHLQNSFSSSCVFDDEYKAGDDVFIKIETAGKDGLTGSVLGLKRDKYIAGLCAAFLLFILLIAKKRGVFSILSLVANIAVFWYALDLYSDGRNILLLSNGMVLFFTILSLLLVSGWNKKTFAAIASTLVSLCLTMLLFKIVMINSDGVDYAFMEYIATPSDLPELFLSQIMLGGLGAIMDVAITEAATVNELIEKNREISFQALARSGREVGHDIMGTMINVMLFTYISGSIPLIILKMKSEVRLHTIILWHLPMEQYRFFIGSIGILLTIPVSLLISAAVFKKWRKFA